MTANGFEFTNEHITAPHVDTKTDTNHEEQAPANAVQTQTNNGQEQHVSTPEVVVPQVTFKQVEDIVKE